MTASKIPVGGTDKDLQTWENDLGDGPVHTEAQTPTDTTGVAFGLLNPQDVRDASPRITRRLDAQDILADTLIGISGDGENAWGFVSPDAGPFAANPAYQPPLSDSAGFVTPSFVRMQDAALYGGRPFVRFSATGGADGGYAILGFTLDVRPGVAYEVSTVVYSDATSTIALGIVDENDSTKSQILSEQNSGAHLFQAQRHAGRFRTGPPPASKYVVDPVIILYVDAGADHQILDILEFGIREVPEVTARIGAKPADWDYAAVTSMTADYQPIITERRLGGASGLLVATATCTYDEPVPGTFVLTSLEWT